NLIDSNTLNEGLRSLVNLNRVLAKEDRILYPDTSKSKQGILRKIYSLSQAIQLFLVNGALINDMEGIVLINADCSHLKFIPHTSFEGSLIYESDFSHSTCLNCNFQNSNLCGTNFTNANLENSSFGYTDMIKAPQIICASITNFEFYEGPSFDSSNLKKVNFSFFPLIYIIGKDKLDVPLGEDPSFTSCDLDSADFRLAMAYTVNNKGRGFDGFSW